MACDGSAYIEQKHPARPGSFCGIISHGDTKIKAWGQALETTNNRMELCAVIFGLRSAIRYLRGFVGPKRVHIVIDSIYIYAAYNAHPKNTNDPGFWMSRRWKNKGGEGIANWDLWLMLEWTLDVAKNEGVHISWEWVKGHGKGQALEVLANAEVHDTCTRLTKDVMEALSTGKQVDITPYFQIVREGVEGKPQPVSSKGGFPTK